MSITASVVPSSHAVRVGETPDPRVAERASRRPYTPKYKAEMLTDYEAADRDGKGALLRREGLYTSLISEWRKQAAKGAIDALGMKQGRPPADPMERDNARSSQLRRRRRTATRRRRWSLRRPSVRCSSSRGR